jgi:hypothetical protein
MTFLEICVKVRQRAGYSGSGPNSVAGQTGVYEKIVDWVKSAYLDVQKEETNWGFLWAENQFTTEVGKRDYSPSVELGLTDFNQFNLDSFFIQRDGSNTKQELTYENYEVFRQFSILNTQSNPHFFTILPDKKIRFDNTPISPEVVTYEYWRKPFAFNVDDDEPAFSSQHHDILIYKALMYYAADEEAGNIYADAKANYEVMLQKLRDDELNPDFISTTPLA